jgi:hypothetical protein
LTRVQRHDRQGAAHAFGIAETDLPHDHVDRFGGLDAQLRRFGAQTFDGLGRGFAGLGPEGAPEPTRVSSIPTAILPMRW